MIYRVSLLIVISILFLHCNAPNNKNAIIANPKSLYNPKYANGFKVEYYPDYKFIYLNNPFDSLAPRRTICKQTSQNFDIKAIPADEHIRKNNLKWIALSSTHISSANLLDLKTSIIGVAEPEYINDKYIQHQITKGEIENVGMAMSPDLEIILNINPAFVMVSPFPDISYHQIREAGIAVIPNASYMESSPLGRAEWLVFMAQLFNKEEKAFITFNEIEKRYNQLKDMTDKIKSLPTIFTGHLYNGIWHSPQKDNYMANFFKDAGTDYIYNQAEGNGTMMLEFESVYNEAFEADYWLIIVNYPGQFSYEAFVKMDQRYADFKAFNNKKIIYTNTNNSLFFEKAEQEPDIVLADLIYAIHPDLLPKYNPTYFKLLK